MNWLQFGRLVHSIYRRGGDLPDLDWIESLGLLAVKIGQVHALRIDFLEREKCEHLAKLYRRNRAMPSEDFDALLESVRPEGFWREIESVRKTALATASVGQVHRGRHRSGDEIVVKLVKAGLRERFGADVRRLRKLIRLATAVYPRLKSVGDPEGILDDIETYTSSELDLRNEIAGQVRLREKQEEYSRAFDLSRLRFPRLYPEASNESVLVSGFVPGSTVDEMLERGHFPYENLLEIFRLHGFFMFCIGTFHGDLHPGNVVLSDGAYYFLDTGYIGTASRRLRHGLFDFFSALSNDDYTSCAVAIRDMSATPLPEAAFDRFTAQMHALYRDFAGATVSELSLTRKMMETIRLAVNSGLSFDRGMFAIIRSLMYLDGMALRCNPDAVLIRDMRPFIVEFRRALTVAEPGF